MKRILLTGASGFVGEHILKVLLALNMDVVAVSRSKPATVGRYRWIEADLLNQPPPNITRNQDISHVLHAAWCVEHGKFWADKSNALWRDSTIAFANSAIQDGVRRFVSIGTCYEYDWPSDDDCDEQLTPTTHHTLYDQAKDETRQALEKIVTGPSLSFSWARLFFPFGKGEPAARLIPNICKAISANLPAQCSSGSAVRDFIAVEDAARLLAELMFSDHMGCVNVASGHATSIADVALAIGRISGRPDLIHLGALPDREGDPPRITAKIGGIGAMPSFSSMSGLEQRLAETYRYWKDQIGAS